ncbi:MAG: flagellar basal body-associated FliL family protein [Gemmatimonadales bacterium]|nr:flagellar basal body-associated FliL family protein [Gemmatimonadales bacterium]
MADPIAEDVPAASGGKMPIIAAAVALLVGVAAGMFVIAPRLPGAAPAAAEAGAAEGKEGEVPKKVLFQLENVIVNPSGSQGQRFIVATVAYEVSSEEIRNVLHESETQIRDAVTGVLEKRTVEELLAPGARDALRSDFAKVVTPYLKGEKVQVFIPQFLVQ